VNQFGFHSLGQFVFWVSLGATTPVWSAPIPLSQQIPQNHAEKLGTLEVHLAPKAQAPKDIAQSPTSKKLELFNSEANPVGGAKEPVEKTQGEEVQSQIPSSFSQTRIVSQGILNQPLQNPLQPSPCWQSLSRSRCSFQPSLARFKQTNPDVAEIPSDLELGVLRVAPETQRSQTELGTLQVEPETAQNNELGTLRVEPGKDELGTLRVAPETTQPDELGTIASPDLNAQSIDGAADPELGTLRLQEDVVPQLPELPSPTKQASVFLLSRIDYFRTTNVFSGIDPTDDGLIRSGVTLFYAPRLGPKTFLVTSIDANLIRYTTLGSTRSGRQGLNYDELRFRAGVFHQLTPRMSGEIGWSNQQLFNAKEGLQTFFSGDRLLGENALRIELSRQDSIARKLTLNTYYQFRLNFSDPNDRSRLINSLTTSLSYDITPKLQTAIDYQVAWSHFTQQSRNDVFNQLVGRLSYTLNRSSQINVFTGFSFGNSSNPDIDFDGFVFGAGLVFNAPLF
jgi:hypothetical protein